MCGIVGGVAKRDIIFKLVECLQRLEYRGYDSAGVVAINNNNSLKCLRTVGKIATLVQNLYASPCPGEIGIAHTRWATHGAPTTYNAHPHVANTQVAVVHNGIIENYELLRSNLRKNGTKFTSDTDSEVIAHLIYSYIKRGMKFLQAVQHAVKKLTGSYALAILNTQEPKTLIVVRSGSPIVIGRGNGENFVASDAIALLPVTNNFVYLEEGDIAHITCDKVTVYDNKLRPIIRPSKTLELYTNTIERGKYRHFMQKEIFEQPHALADTLDERIIAGTIPPEIFGSNAKKIFPRIKRIQIAACGSSFHAAYIGKYWLEKYLQIPCNVEIASEFRYRHVVVELGTLFVTISQSGETADTLAALRRAKKLPFLTTLAICNVPESSLVRESDLVLLNRAGTEIGVATTKAFTAQLTTILMLTIALSKYYRPSNKATKSLIKQLTDLPRLAQKVLKLDKKISSLAQLLKSSNNAFYLGRGATYPLALEGALKLKEISYIHAEAYPAGELKHGALALIEEGTSVIVLAPDDELHEKLYSNLQEVKARGGVLLVFAAQSLKYKNLNGWHICHMPQVPPAIVPIIYAIPLQLLAYHVAVLKGTDIDRPRNLAKSVTVE